MESQIKRQSAGGGAVAWGVILVVAGLFFLAAQFLPGAFGEGSWPLFVVLGGLAFLVLGATVRGVSGFLIPGSIITTAGLILMVQNAFALWQTWSYAWALVAPGAVGVGIMLMGFLNHDREAVQGGAGTALIGLVLFLAFGAFFEGFFHISGLSLGGAFGILIPVLLIGLGIVIILQRLGAARRPQG